MKPFPLVPWLEKNNLKPYLFAKQAGLAYRTVYAYVNGDRFMQCDTRCLMAIEAGTNGEVTLRDMVSWMEMKRAQVEHEKEVT
jgi:hypothetical protein